MAAMAVTNSGYYSNQPHTRNLKVASITYLNADLLFNYHAYIFLWIILSLYTNCTKDFQHYPHFFGSHHGYLIQDILCTFRWIIRGMKNFKKFSVPLLLLRFGPLSGLSTRQVQRQTTWTKTSWTIRAIVITTVATIMHFYL